MPPAEDAEEIARLRLELRLLREKVHRLEHELDTMRPVIAAVKRTEFWDFTPYDIRPDPSWVAADRSDVEGLLAALACVDHWRPWRTTLERRWVA